MDARPKSDGGAERLRLTPTFRSTVGLLLAVVTVVSITATLRQPPAATAPNCLNAEQALAVLQAARPLLTQRQEGGR
jgi:hypothetical protein